MLNLGLITLHSGFLKSVLACHEAYFEDTAAPTPSQKSLQVFTRHIPGTCRLLHVQ